MKKRRASVARFYLSRMYPPYPPHPGFQPPPNYPDWAGRRALKSTFLAIAGALWLGALALPAYTDDTPGIAVFIMGWMTLFTEDIFAFFAWIGNIPFIVGVFMFIFGRRKSIVRTAMILSVTAAVLSLGAFTVDVVPSYQHDSHVSPDFGCYTWVISCLMMMTGTIVYYTQLSANEKLQNACW